MLHILIPAIELYDEKDQRFFMSKSYELQLEHSLVSLSKWESKWLKPFLTKEVKTKEEQIDYIRCMTMTQNVDPMAYSLITQDVFNQIIEYIDAPMTATTFGEDKDIPGREVITSEIIYYWMVTFNIPSEYQKWHLNRLLTLIRVCNIKNQPPKKGNRKDLISRNRALNEARKAKYHTNG